MEIQKKRITLNLNIFPEWFEGMVFAAICFAFIEFGIVKYGWDAASWLQIHGVPNWILPFVTFADFSAFLVNAMACVGLVYSLLHAICASELSEKERNEFRSMTRWGFLFMNPIGVYFCCLVLYCGIAALIGYGMYSGFRKCTTVRVRPA